MDNLVSVIILNYNGKWWLERCLDSLYSQTFRRFEIVFVDNCSTDGSADFVSERYPDVHIIRSDRNLGFSGGNNVGIAAVAGQYILLLNNDTWLEPDFLERMVGFYETHNYDILGPVEADYYTKKPLLYTTLLDLFGHFIYVPKGSTRKENFYLSGACLFFSKKYYFETGGFDNQFFMYSEDADWFWRIRLFGGKVFQIEDMRCYHIGAGSTGGGIKYLSFLWRNQNTLQMLLKNYRWYNVLWVLPVYVLQNCLEILFFLLLFKPRIAYSYVQGWVFNINHLREIIQKRRLVQRNRRVGDCAILKQMYLGFGKFTHMVSYIRLLASRDKIGYLDSVNKTQLK